MKKIIAEQGAKSCVASYVSAMDRNRSNFQKDRLTLTLDQWVTAV
jgi:hypothetical protein